MKIKLEYPTIMYINRDADLFDAAIFFDLSVVSCITYFKNYDTDYSYFIVKILGFGFRLVWEEQ